jgi:hypothetical protein
MVGEKNALALLKERHSSLRSFLEKYFSYFTITYSDDFNVNEFSISLNRAAFVDDTDNDEDEERDEERDDPDNSGDNHGGYGSVDDYTETESEENEDEDMISSLKTNTGKSSMIK